MFPRDADVRRVLKRYPDVTHDERQALRGWYRRARAPELVAALNDPSLEPSLARLRRDLANGAPTAGPSLLLLAAGILALLVATLG